MVPDQEIGEKIARSLLAKRLAACVSVASEAHSFYWWKGKITRDREYQLTIKTRAECYSALETEIVSSHPYEIPEIVSLPIGTGYLPYLDWITAETD